MNPPPPPNLPPELREKSFVHHAAALSLRIALAVALISFVQDIISSGSTPVSRVEQIIVGLVVLLLALIGFGLAIAGFCGIPRHGTEDILGRSIAGFVFNGFFLLMFAVALVATFVNAAKSRQFYREIGATARQAQENARNSFNPKTGLTNFDMANFEHLHTQLDNAAQNLSGDDALMFKARSLMNTRMEIVARKYVAANNDLGAAHVLNLTDLMNEQQIGTRRAVVRDFIAASAELANTISNSAADFHADLVKLGVAPEKINSALKGFQNNWEVRGPLMLQIRDCDNRIGQAMLSTLDVLDQNWGKWDYNSDTKVVTFTDPAAREAYRRLISEIRSANQEQIRLQAELLSLPQ